MPTEICLAALLEAFANDQWIEHYTEEQAVEAVMDRFKRLVEAEMEMVEVRVGSRVRYRTFVQAQPPDA